MRTSSRTNVFTRLLQLGLFGGALLFAAQGFAQTDPGQTYQEAIKHCDSIADEAERRDCRRDAGAALQEARNHPDKYRQIDEQTLMQNRLSRCERLPAAQRELCIKTMQEGTETQTMGSVDGGGVLRKTTIREKGAPQSQTAPSGQQPAGQTSQPQGATESQGMPTSNTEEPLKAKESYGAHPVR